MERVVVFFFFPVEEDNFTYENKGKKRIKEASVPNGVASGAGRNDSRESSLDVLSGREQLTVCFLIAPN